MFAVTSAGGAEFIQDGRFLRTGCIFVPCMDCFPILSFGSWTHILSLLGKAMFGHIEL